MALVPLASAGPVMQTVNGLVVLVVGASIYVLNHDASSQVTVYATESVGGATLSQPLASDSAGRIPGWVAAGEYDLAVSSQLGSYLQPVEMVDASGGGGGGSSTLAGLTDVSISAPANLQSLVYDSGSGKWKNAAATAFGNYLRFTDQGLAAGSASTDIGTWTVPAALAAVHCRLTAAGAGGGGGGSALTSGGVNGQVGGTGGTAGDVRDLVLTSNEGLSAGSVLHMVIGAGSIGGTGGAANGNAGGISGSAGDTAIEIPGNPNPFNAQVWTIGAIAASGGGANSTVGAQPTPYGTGAVMPTTELPTPGTGGASGQSTATPMIWVVGGSGGTAANATKGGRGGVGLAYGSVITNQNTQAGQSATTAGEAGIAATQPGCGGGGGGGGAPGGVGGAGGNGANGMIELWW